MSKVVFPWLPGNQGWASFEEHAGQITHISPTGLAIAPDGSIHRAEQPDIGQVAETARAKGVLCVPLVVNQGFSAESAAAILCDPAKRREAADRLAQLVMDNGWDGINLDFEGPWAFRSEYAAFVARVADRLRPRGKLVTVDVVAQKRPPTGQPEATALSWAEPYDYAALGPLVDLFIVMGYDYHWRGGPPGPVGPAWWLEEVLEYTTHLVPADKVVLGLPFYGYHWAVDGAGQTVQGNYVPYAEAERLRQEHGAFKSWDFDGLCRHFHFRGEDGLEHVVYYDDAASIARRLTLADRFRLAGVAFWSLGQEDPGVWAEIAAWRSPAPPA